MYKPPKLIMQKTLCQIARPPNISPRWGLYLEIALKYKVKQRKTVNFLPRIRLAQSIFKHKFPSVHKPLQK